MPSPGELTDFAHELADAARAIQRRWFRAELDIEVKADESPVTIADRETELAMRALIQARFPEHGIFGEEFGRQQLDAEYVWVLDPIDGTKSFICGRPQFGTLIGLLKDGKPLLGIIDQAILAERWVGVAGEPTTFNGRPVKVRACAALAEAVLCSTSRRLFEPGPMREAFDTIEAKARLSQFSTDCYGYGLVALGLADVVVEHGLQPYDFVALIQVLEGAGAVITDWRGRPIELSSPGRVVASGDRRVHDEVLTMLSALPD